MEHGEVHIAMKAGNMTNKQLLAVEKKWSSNVLVFSKVPGAPWLGIRQVGMLLNVTQYPILRLVL
jgi:hypothetical protein